MELIAESTKKGFCPNCGAGLLEDNYKKTEYEDNTLYITFDCVCGCEVEEVYSLRNIYGYSNAWRAADNTN